MARYTKTDAAESTSDSKQSAPATPGLILGARVRVHPGRDNERCGTIVEDFGEHVGVPVVIGDTHIVGPARRWAIDLDDGDLIFLDSEHFTLE